MSRLPESIPIEAKTRRGSLWASGFVSRPTRKLVRASGVCSRGMRTRPTDARVDQTDLGEFTLDRAVRYLRLHTTRSNIQAGTVKHRALGLFSKSQLKTRPPHSSATS